MFSTQLIRAGHTRRFVLMPLPAEGWELTVEEDHRVVRRAHYTDWHRVERALAALERELDVLTAGGWTRIGDPASAGTQSTNR